jgi:hypothetical protein
MTYTLYNGNEEVEVSLNFLHECIVIQGMMDCTEGDIPNRIPIPISDMKNIKKYIGFFEELESMMVETNTDGEVSYLDYITKYRNEFIQNYTNKNVLPPYCKRLSEMYKEYGQETIAEFIKFDKFFNNPKIIKGIMLCLTGAIFYNDTDEGDKTISEGIMSGIMEVLQREASKGPVLGTQEE